MNNVTTPVLRSALCAIFLLPLPAWANPVVLKPAPDSQLVPNTDAAISVRDGVRVTVDASAWTGEPGTLQDGIIPLKVTIENLVGKPVQVRYSQMVLRSPAGVQRHPLSMKATGDPRRPTREMTELALPEGLVAPGEFTEGFLYFPQLPVGTDQVVFAAGVEGKDGEKVVKLTFPFIVG